MVFHTDCDGADFDTGGEYGVFGFSEAELFSGEGPVYATPATVDLARILLPDAGHLQEEEARYRNKHQLSKHKPALPLYTVENAVAALELLQPVKYGQVVALSSTLGFELMPAGHILGSSFVRVREGDTALARLFRYPNDTRHANRLAQGGIKCGF